MSDQFVCIAFRGRSHTNAAVGCHQEHYEVLATDSALEVTNFVAKQWAWNQIRRVAGDERLKVTIYWNGMLLVSEDGVARVWLQEFANPTFSQDVYRMRHEPGYKIWNEISAAANLIVEQQVAEYKAEEAKRLSLAERKQTETARQRRYEYYLALQKEFANVASDT